MPISKDQLENLVASNGDVVGLSGEKIGGIGTIYLNDMTGEPEWVTVRAGLFGASESFVALSGARIAENDIHVGYEKETVKDAPASTQMAISVPRKSNSSTPTTGSQVLSPPGTRPLRSTTTPSSQVLSPLGIRPVKSTTTSTAPPRDTTRPVRQPTRR